MESPVTNQIWLHDNLASAKCCQNFSTPGQLTFIGRDMGIQLIIISIASNFTTNNFLNFLLSSFKTPPYHFELDCWWSKYCEQCFSEKTFLERLPVAICQLEESEDMAGLFLLTSTSTSFLINFLTSYFQ